MNRRTAVRNLLAAGAGSVFTRWLAGSPLEDLPEEDSGISTNFAATFVSSAAGRECQGQQRRLGGGAFERELQRL
jgi:hypothetical protein